MANKLIAGLDEVGMGPVAGPQVVVVAAFAGDRPKDLADVDDSKKLSRKKREELVPAILKHTKFFGFGWSSAEEIDEFGKLECWQRAAMGALVGAPKFSNLIVDGEYRVEDYKGPQEVVVKADHLYWQVSAASILAKVMRDNDMEYLAEFHKGYGWETNAGYGTEAHLKAIKTLGLTQFHRRTFLKKHVRR